MVELLNFLNKWWKGRQFEWMSTFVTTNGTFDISNGGQHVADVFVYVENAEGVYVNNVFLTQYASLSFPAQPNERQRGQLQIEFPAGAATPKCVIYRKVYQ